ncbi:hypothetical protein GH146_01720 [archaeon]|jgi:hypothetical protein|nr:hypothetical protein [archaeon]
MPQQEIELIDHSRGEHILMRFPDRYIQAMLPILAILEGASQNQNYSIHFRPPLHIENESTGESFTLPRGTDIIAQTNLRMSRYLHIQGIRRPIILGAIVAAMEVNEI